ncbi:MAG: hypothetical protein IJN67_12720, partial [Oscillospiraceae bacterium]|nr:hypothetical protein [Oscillospiraceae bacterium]
DKRQKALFWSFSALQNSALGECPSLDDSIIPHLDSLVVPFFVSFFSRVCSAGITQFRGL